MPGADPIALAYAGHQFGGFSPSLGDGRAHLLGEIWSLRTAARFDLQLKGSGRTPFSRGRRWQGGRRPDAARIPDLGGDGTPWASPPPGRWPWSPTGEDIWRDDGRLPGAVLARVAASHIRVGTFQFFAARGEGDKLQALADYTIARHYPAGCTGALGPVRRRIARARRG